MTNIYDRRDRGDSGSSNREFGRRDRDAERGGGGRGYGRSGDRGGRGYGRGSAGGRGSGSDRRGRGRGDRSSNKSVEAAASSDNTSAQAAPAASKAAPDPAAVAEKEGSATPALAKPLTSRPLQGAWGARAAAASTPVPTPAVAPPSPAPAAPEPVEESPETIIEESFVNEQHEFDVGVVSAQDPTPAGVTVTENIPVVVPEPKPAPVAPGGNVWATKGSAHLINAEKKPLSPSVAEEVSFTIDEPLMPAPDLVVETTDNLDDGLSANLNGTMNATSGWVTESSPVGPVSVDVVDAPLLEIPAPEEIVLQVPVLEPAVPEAAPVEIETALKPTSVLNMGHWETGEGEEAVSHDFGFGSFGQENDVTSVDETTISIPVVPTPVASAPLQENTAPVAAPTVSPARPPPGLGIGMPPMPEKIVHVHELENKLENASLNKDEEPKKSDTLSDNQYAAPQNAAPANVPPEGFAQMPQPGVPQQNYAGQYGMGMYNYNGQAGGVPTPNGFMGAGVPGGVPLGVPPQQKQHGLGQQQASGLPQQQASIYGAPAPTAQTQTSETNGTGNNETNGTSAIPPNSGMPPGMAGMAHYNPALFYGQQPYLAGQPHGVNAYGFGYAGQFGGVQAGYGYQQVMGQGAGYGQPYDDQTQHHGGNNHQGGYNNKNPGGGGGGGGYRGRNNHHNQYPNQYNPQGHGAYGGQPYNMGYNDQQFTQRGGYGQQQIDPYMQQNSGGYHQDNDHGKGNKSKGNNRNNFGNSQNMPQTQYQQGGNQFGGLQGATASDSNPTFQGWGNGGL